MNEKPPGGELPPPVDTEARTAHEQEQTLLAESLLERVDEIIDAETDPVRQSALLAAGMRAGDTRYADRAVDLIEAIPKNKCGPAKDTAIGLWELKYRGHDAAAINAGASRLMHHVQEEPAAQRHTVVERLLKGGILGEGEEFRRFYTPNYLNQHDDASSIRHVLNFLTLLAENGTDVLAEGSPYRYMRSTAERILATRDRPGELGEYGEWPSHLTSLGEAFARGDNIPRALELLEQARYLRQEQEIALAIADSCDDPKLCERMEQRVRSSLACESVSSISAATLAEHFIGKGSDADIAKADKLMEDASVVALLSANAWAAYYAHTGDLAARGRAVEGWKRSFGDNNRSYVVRVAVKDAELGLHEWDDETFEQSPLPLIVGEITHIPEPKHVKDGLKRSGMGVNKGWAYMVLAEHFAKTGNPGLPRLIETVLTLEAPADRVKGLAAAAVGLQTAA